MAHLAFSETRELGLSAAIMLYDRFTDANRLVDDVEVRLASQLALQPFQQSPAATFLFFDLVPGAYVVQVREPRRARPFYRAVDIPIAVPLPHSLWPAFPDALLADPTKPLDDPAQAPAYRTQRAAATLSPTPAYPFPAGTTLIRGTARTAGGPLAGAHVRILGDALEYVTEPDGEFVLFRRSSPATATVTVRATHAQHPDTDQPVVLRRGMTAATTIQMP